MTPAKPQDPAPTGDMMEKPPERFEEIGGEGLAASTVMSNVDHEVEPWADARLRGEEVYGRHAGWNFNGLVWYDREAQCFKEAVFRYHSHVATLEAPTLPELMEAVNAEYGSD